MLPITLTNQVRTLTSKVIYFYTRSGKTEAALDGVEIEKYKLNNLSEDVVNFDEHEIIYIGTPTYGRGTPPEYFLKLLPKLNSLKGKNIGLFGSGNTIYGDDFCGALDVLEQILEKKNKILFKFKFEGMPTGKQVQELKQLIER